MCCLTCLLELKCTVWILFWIQTCFPFKCNNVFAVSWLHLGSAICLLLAAMLSDASHPRDLAFNENLKANSKLFEKSIINFGLYATTVPVMIKDCISGEHFYRNDYRFYKGKEGFAFTGCFALVSVVLIVAVMMELYDVVNTEMIYEQYFPYCIRDRYLIDRFCLLSKREIDNGEDWCDDIKLAFSNSYLCTEHKLRIRSGGFAFLAVLFHLVIIAGYAQMSYRPWSWANIKKRHAEDALVGEHRKKRRKDLAKLAPAKLQIAIEKKKIRLAEQKKLEQEIKDAEEKRDMNIRLKNVRRRLAHRASRKERKEMKQKERQERRQRRMSEEKSGV
ncbi:unnamed protein product [Allacma fusca]|uniref:Uncharacterized protein n=1 Tax=Allacma fusca TaxID=39272 RepID=A0A8J2NSX4_9HEXA|nr:unnamed protein product [Allacma fusca]